jgi:hypothetical protein
VFRRYHCRIDKWLKQLLSSRSKRPIEVADDALTLIIAILALEPGKRVTAAQALTAPYFRGPADELAQRGHAWWVDRSGQAHDQMPL